MKVEDLQKSIQEDEKNGRQDNTYWIKLLILNARYLNSQLDKIIDILKTSIPIAYRVKEHKHILRKSPKLAQIYLPSFTVYACKEKGCSKCELRPNL